MKPPKPFKPGPATIKALAILAEFPGCNAGGFAEKMWPGNPMHTKHSGNLGGVQIGKAGWLCGGSFLAKLKRHGLVKEDTKQWGGSLHSQGYTLTEAGKGALYEAEKPALMALTPVADAVLPV